MSTAATGETPNTGTMADEEEEEEPQIDLSLLDAWKSPSSPETELQKLTSRESVQSRLRTFRPLTYFCKPVSLSPIVCARFGWINTSADLLKCSSCMAALVVKIHPKITKQSTIEKIIQTYQTKLATAHKPNCPFRVEAELHLLFKDKDLQRPFEDIMTVPWHFVSLVPPDVLEMLEQPIPLPLIRARFEKLVDFIFGGDNNMNPSHEERPPWKLPKLELPKEILELALEETDQTSNPTQRRMLSKLMFHHRKSFPASGEEHATLLNKLEDILLTQNHENEDQAQSHIIEPWEDLLEALTAMALLGWEPTEERGKINSQTSVSLQCPICLSNMNFKLQKDDNHPPLQDQDKTGTIDEPASKRQRTNDSSSFNPLTSHRFYCPYVCGFPSDGARKTKPIWEIVAKKLLKNRQKAELAEMRENAYDANQAELDGEAAVDRIRLLLKSVVSSRPRGKPGKKTPFLTF